MVGDASYGGSPLRLSQLKPHYHLKFNKTERPLISTPALHGERISFFHPITAAEINVTAPWPKDLTVAMKYLRRYAV